MLDAVFFAGGLVVLIPTSLMALEIFRAYKKAKSDRQQIEWITDQLDRALIEIGSDDGDRIIVGLHILVALNDPNLRLKALPRLAELIQDSNPLIKKHAQLTLKELSVRREDNEGKDV